MNTEELEFLAVTISTKVEVDKIYCIKYQNGTVEMYHLIIIVGHNTARKFPELKPFIEMVTLRHSGISYTLLTNSNITALIKAGHLYYSGVCTYENLLFNNPKSKALPVIIPSEYKDWQNRAYQQYKLLLENTNQFSEGAGFYLADGNNKSAAFMLHQAFELTYRALESSVIGKEKRTHSLTHHQDYIKEYLPQIGEVFPTDTDENILILRSVNRAYNDVRYESDYSIKDEYLPILSQRAADLKTEIEKYFQDLLSSELKEPIADLSSDRALKPEVVIEEKTKRPRIKTSSAITLSKGSNPLETAINFIVEHAEAQKVYLFAKEVRDTSRMNLFNPALNGKKSLEHYGLLVISPLKYPYEANLQYRVNELDENIVITLLIHHPTEVLKYLNRNNPFFSKVVTKENLLYSKEPETTECKVIPENTSYWRKAEVSAMHRLSRANELKIAANTLADDNQQELSVSLSLISQSIEQVCLGLINIAIGYTPNSTKISHLINICGFIWPEGKKFLHNGLDYDEVLYKILCGSISALRYTAAPYDDIEIGDSKTILHRACVYVEMAEIQILGLMDENFKNHIKGQPDNSEALAEPS